jgi:hypothetical protein
MPRSKTASATSICDALREALAGPGPEKRRLQAAADLLERAIGARVAFCEILGKRWSHLCGRPDFLTPSRRVLLTSRLGLLADGIPAESGDWERAMACLREWFADQPNP